MQSYQVAIIGAGPGGYVAAIRSAQLGLQTVLIEKEKVGGTCLNIGCIPTKTLMKNAEILHEIKGAKKRGIIVGEPAVDMKNTMKLKNRVVSQLVGGIQMLLERNGVTVVKGEAVVKSAHSIQVGEEELTCDNLIIATGSSNFFPPIPGLKDAGILTSTELLDIDHVPDSLCIIGGGVIGCELATIFSAFGTKVTIVEMMPQLVPSMDLEVAETLRAGLAGGGITIKTNCKVTEVRREDEGYCIHISDEDGGEESILTTNVLVSVGRRANLAGLERLGLELDRGYVKTDEYMQTSVDGVYAIGDVTGKIQLAHVANAQGLVAAERLAGRSGQMRYDSVPSCIYTIPEIGSVGMTEKAAVEAGYEVSIGKFPMGACARAKAVGAADGFLAHGCVVLIPFFAFPLGANLNFSQLLQGGIPGILLGVICTIATGTAGYFVIRAMGERKAAGAAIGTTAGNAVGTPKVLGEADPTLAAIAAISTVQVAAAIIVTAILCPLYVSFLDKHLRKKYGTTPEGKIVQAAKVKETA